MSSLGDTLATTNYSWVNRRISTWRPDWEKASNNFVYQILICERKDILDEDTGDVVKSEYTVTFDKSKTNADCKDRSALHSLQRLVKTHSGMDYLNSTTEHFDTHGGLRGKNSGLLGSRQVPKHLFFP